MKLFKSIKRWVILNIAQRFYPVAPFVQSVCDELVSPKGDFGLHAIKDDRITLSVGQKTRRPFLFEAGIRLDVANEGRVIALRSNFFEEVPLNITEQLVLAEAFERWVKNELNPFDGLSEPIYL